MDISSAIFDPELGCTAFTVERITYTRTRAAHKAVPVQTALTLAGSIESIVITVNVQV